MFWLVFLKMGVWYIKIIEIDPFRTVYRKYAHKMCTKVHKVLKSCPQLPKLCTRHYVTKIIGFHSSKRIWDPLPPAICYFCGGQRRVFSNGLIKVMLCFKFRSGPVILHGVFIVSPWCLQRSLRGHSWLLWTLLVMAKWFHTPNWTFFFSDQLSKIKSLLGFFCSTFFKKIHWTFHSGSAPASLNIFSSLSTI